MLHEAPQGQIDTLFNIYILTYKGISLASLETGFILNYFLRTYLDTSYLYTYTHVMVCTTNILFPFCCMDSHFRETKPNDYLMELKWVPSNEHQSDAEWITHKRIDPIHSSLHMYIYIYIHRISSIISRARIRPRP